MRHEPIEVDFRIVDECDRRIDDLTEVFEFDWDRHLLDHASSQALSDVPFRCRGVDPFIRDGAGPPETFGHIKPSALPGAAHVL